MSNLLCKIIGHKEKQVEKVDADVTVCPRCKEIQSTPDDNEREQSPETQQITVTRGGRELECPNCGYEDVSRSMFAGDSCPACNRGYLEESGTRETTAGKIYSETN